MQTECKVLMHVTQKINMDREIVESTGISQNRRLDMEHAIRNVYICAFIHIYDIYTNRRPHLIPGSDLILGPNLILGPTTPPLVLLLFSPLGLCLIRLS